MTVDWLPILAACAAVAAIVAFGAPTLLRRARSIMFTMLAVAVIAVVLMGATLLVAARWMFLSEHDLDLLLPLLGLCGLLGTLVGSVAAWLLARDVRDVRAGVERISAGAFDSVLRIDRRDEIGDLAAAVNTMARRLTAIECERTLLITSVSHDLRSPLAALRANIEAVRDGVAVDPDRSLAAMERQAEALGDLIDDLFLHSRLAAGSMVMQTRDIDLGELVEESVEMMRPVAVGRAVDLDVRLDTAGSVLTAAVDAAQFGRVMRNLIDNAVRHAGPGGKVCASVTTGRPAGGAGDAVCIAVADSGPGFPSDFVHMAFEPFTRADPARDRSNATAGLGLSIARAIVVAHGGSITIEPGPGGLVNITVPRRVS